jgi:FkbM family methyltransferase
LLRLAAAAPGIDVSGKITELMHGGQNFALYGAVEQAWVFVGLVLYERCGLTLKCFLDDSAESGSAVKVKEMEIDSFTPWDIRLDDDFRKDTLVVVVQIPPLHENFKAAAELLRALGYQKIIHAFDIMLPLLSYSTEIENGREAFPTEAEDIAKAFDLMSDTNSEDVFLEIIRAHTTLEYNIPVLSPGIMQYYDVSLPLAEKYNCFIDCGAFVGDTLEGFVKRYGAKRYFTDYYIGFEPDLRFFPALLDTVNRLRPYVGACVIIPAGVGSRNALSRFFLTGPACSRINPHGEGTIQMLRLDDIVKNYDRTLIKMDIEGSETEALTGAKRLITESRPDMAISVYHNVSDVWRIPLMLNDWLPGYNFYLRNHYHMAMETVLYATKIP